MSALPEDASPAAAPGRRPGLRERKKARTRAAIREHAFRLFREQGYDATTVEQIAEAAEVSPSTFFRYFPTKEDVVMQDDMDLLWAEAVRAQPAELSPVAALRAAIPSAFAGLSRQQLELMEESMALAVSMPAIRARFLDEFGRSINVIAEAMAERAGRSPSDPAARTLAGAVMGIAMAAWFGAGDPHELDLQAMLTRYDEGLAFLEAGFPL